MLGHASNSVVEYQKNCLFNNIFYCTTFPINYKNRSTNILQCRFDSVTYMRVVLKEKYDNQTTKKYPFICYYHQNLRMDLINEYLW